MVVPSNIYFLIFATMRTLWDLPQFHHNHYITGVMYLLLGLPILVNIVFITLALMPLCCRACGYNLCMKATATIESHRKVLREVLPLYSLVVPIFFILLCLYPFIRLSSPSATLLFNIFYCTPGLVYALSFALHLWLIRKNLKKLRGKKKSFGYGSFQHCTHRATAFTSEGMSETCNTEHVVVNESEEDTRFLLRNISKEYQ